jgi:hypothetical protein
MSRKRIAVLIFVVIIVAAVWGAYRYRLLIAVRLWHMRHGTTTGFGGYTIPVPQNWYPQTQADGLLLIRLDTADQTPRHRLKSHASILLLPQQQLSDQDLNRILSVELRALKEHGVQPVLQRTINTDHLAIFCLGGDKLGSNGILDAEPTSWHCRSASGLMISFESTEPDMTQVWEILSGIRTKS